MRVMLLWKKGLKLQGWLIANSFLQTDKFSEHVDWLLQRSKEMGLVMRYMGNAELLPVLGEKDSLLFLQNRPDFVLFWDKDIRLAKTLEAQGLRLYNRADAIAACDDKYACFCKLEKEGHFSLPKTIAAPMTYENIGYTNYDFLEQAAAKISFPMVVKECYGSFGEQVYLVKNQKELFDRVAMIGCRPFLMQEYIEASKGVDLRLQVVGDEVVCAMKRMAQGEEFRANLTLGGSMQAYMPSKEECRLAVDVCRALQLDFAGVDLLLDGDKRYVCEVNSNAHFKRIAACTGVDVATAILRYIINTNNRMNE